MKIMLKLGKQDWKYNKDMRENFELITIRKLVNNNYNSKVRIRNDHFFEAVSYCLVI